MRTMIEAVPSEARAIGQRLKEALAPHRVYLFGSSRTGRGGPDSDLDSRRGIEFEAIPL